HTLSLAISPTESAQLAVGMYTLLRRPVELGLTGEEPLLASLERFKSEGRLAALTNAYDVFEADDPQALLNDPDVLIAPDALSTTTTWIGVNDLQHPYARYGGLGQVNQFIFNPDGTGSLNRSDEPLATTWIAEN